MLRVLFHLGETQWHKDSTTHKKAVKGSSIAIVDWVNANGLRHLSVFYQDPELRLREYLYNFSVEHWAFSEPFVEICLFIDDTHRLYQVTLTLVYSLVEPP